MKKNFLKIGAAGLLALSLASGVFSSCKKDNQTTGESEAVIEQNEALPTADQLSVKSSAKAVVLGSDRSEFNASIINRFSNKVDAICSDASAFVFTSGYAMNFTQNDVTAMLEAYVDGASFIFLDPSFGDMAQLKTMISSAISSLLASDADFDTDAASHFYEMMDRVREMSALKHYNNAESIAFRGTDIYVVCSLEDMADNSSSNTFGFHSAGDDAGEDKCADNAYEPSEYDHGRSADLLVGWMQSGESDSSKSLLASTLGSEESAAIDKYMTGYRVTVQHSVGPSRALGRTLLYEMVYTVYSAYDFDKNTDYYFVRLEPNFHCSALGCRNGDRNWVSANKVVVFDDGSTSGEFWSSKTDLWYGPYMSKFDYTPVLSHENGNPVSGATLLAASPKTDVSGTSGYSTGFSYSLSGNVGFNGEGVSGGITGGVSFSESHSHSENSLKVYHSENGSVPNWRIEGIVPQCHIGFFSYYHDEVATFQKNDWQTEFTWIVSVPNPHTDKPYYVIASDITEITELNYNIYDLELRVHPTSAAMIRLCEPNRSKENFTMICSDASLQDRVEKQLKQTWQNEFTYYALNTDAAIDGAKTMFEKVKVAVKGYAGTLKKYGFTDSYTFKLSRNDGTVLSTFTLDNGEVK